jgi:ADP-ribose pyrophosphatase YjhB (NUDIX family)
VTQPSVSLVGSFRRHYPEVLRAAAIFTAAGIMVKSPPISRIIDPVRDYVRFESDPPQDSDFDLQAATLEKIFSSDFVYVVNPGGYMGTMTAYELGRVVERGMAVYYAQPPEGFLISIPDGTVLSAEELVAGLAGGLVSARPFRRPRVAALPAADIVIFTIREQRLHVLVVKRGTKPYRGKLALPGGFVRPGESLEDTAKRELREETGLDGSRILLRQVHTYSGPGRDPRGRVVTTAFLAIAPNLPQATGGTDAARADWVEVEPSLWQGSGQLAFDHAVIVQQALEHARGLLEHTTVAAAFCGKLFTISELRQVYEAVWDIHLNPQNFQRKVRSTEGFVVDTGRKRETRSGRPAELFRAGPARILYPPMLRSGQPE